jgi:hypothetical protein
MKIFFAITLILGCALALPICLYVWAMTHRNIIQSDGWVPRAVAAKALDEEFLPKSGTRVRYAVASVGMQGYCLAFVTDGSTAELHTYAQNLIGKFGGAIEAIETDEFPLIRGQVNDISSVFYVNLDWMLPVTNGNGTCYTSVEHHGPVIFVDDDNHLLHFLMTD